MLNRENGEWRMIVVQICVDTSSENETAQNRAGCRFQIRVPNSLIQHRETRNGMEISSILIC